MSEEKPERRHREHDEKEGEGMQEKWRRDPISGLFFGLILILLGVVFSFQRRVGYRGVTGGNTSLSVWGLFLLLR